MAFFWKHLQVVTHNLNKIFQFFLHYYLGLQVFLLKAQLVLQQNGDEL